MKKLNLDHNKLNSCDNVYDFRDILKEMGKEVIYFNGTFE